MITCNNTDMNAWYYFLSKILVVSLYKLPYYYDLKISILFYNHKFFLNWLIFYILLLLHFNTITFSKLLIFEKTILISTVRIPVFSINLFILDYLYKVLPLAYSLSLKRLASITPKKLFVFFFGIANFPIFYDAPGLLNKDNGSFNKLKLHIFLKIKGYSQYHCNCFLGLKKIPLL